MRRKTLLAAAFATLMLAPIAVFSQCDPNQSQPSGCLCIYLCTSGVSGSGCNKTVSWTTQQEPQFGSFQIWRSYDGANFMLIATNPGNPGSLTPKSYSYSDVSPCSNGSSNLYYYIVLLDNGAEISRTPIRVTTANCAGTCPGPACGGVAFSGFSSPKQVGQTMQLTLTGSNPQPIEWTSTNTNVATVSSTGLVTAVACGTTTIKGKYKVCNLEVTQTLVVNPANNFLCPQACSGIFTNTTLSGNPGDVVVLRLSFGGYISWNGMSNGTGAQISLTANGVANSGATAHYYSSTGFSLSRDISFTMPASTVNVVTTVVVHNSSTMYSSTGTLTVVSVNGVPVNNQGVVCGGNSGGSW